MTSQAGTIAAAAEAEQDNVDDGSREDDDSGEVGTLLSLSPSSSSSSSSRFKSIHTALVTARYTIIVEHFFNTLHSNNTIQSI